MSTNTDTNKYTILFAIGMVVVVGSLLAFTASSLKPNIKENERMEKQQNILYAMGINENGATQGLPLHIHVPKLSKAETLSRGLRPWAAKAPSKTAIPPIRLANKIILRSISIYKVFNLLH